MARKDVTLNLEKEDRHEIFDYKDSLVFSDKVAKETLATICEKYGEDVKVLLSQQDELKIEDDIVYVKKHFEVYMLEKVEHIKQPKESYFIKLPVISKISNCWKPIVDINELDKVVKELLVQSIKNKVIKFDERKELCTSDQMVDLYLSKDVTIRCQYAVVLDIVASMKKTEIVPALSNFVHVVTKSRSLHAEDDLHLVLEVPAHQLSLVIGTRGRNAATLSKRLHGRKVTFTEFL